jgi:hypothetical protein
VSSAGSLIRGNGITSSTRLGVGSYQVTANFDVTNCAYYVTNGVTGVLDPNDEEGGYARVGQTAGNSQKVTVLMFRNYTVRVDYPFHIAIVC